MGPSIKYITLFWANFYPLPLSHFVTHPGTSPKSTSHISDPPIFSRPSTKTRTKAPCTNSLSIVHGGLCSGLLTGVSCVESFVRGDFCPFPLLLEYICYNRKLKITLDFMFHMYDKKFVSVTPHALDPLHCHKLLHLLGPPHSPSSVTYFMDGPHKPYSTNY